MFMRKIFELLAAGPSGPRGRLRDNNFDALRVVFASMVVLFHIGFLTRVASLGWLTHVQATFAVQAFFVVSGFLVTMSYEKSATALEYAMKRLRRIAPAYLAVVTGAALALSLESTLSARAYFTSSGFWRYLEYNLILSNFRAPDLPGVFTRNFETAVNGSLWTIKIEVAFYMAVPFIVWAVRRIGYRRVLPLIFALSLAWRFGFEIPSVDHHGDFYDRLARQLPGQLAFFVGGAWAYYRLLEDRLPRALPAIVGVVLYWFTADELNISYFNWFVAPFAATAIVTWAALAGPRLPAMGKHGDFSYGIYLYHFPIVQTLLAVGLFSWSPFLAVAMVVVSVALCSFLSWHFVEAPALRRKPKSDLVHKPQTAA
jgi:peptidoglycan/LPS O-acetylase OafA/YrhL